MQALSVFSFSLPLVLTGKKHNTEKIQAHNFRKKNSMSCAFFFLKIADVIRMNGKTRIIANMKTKKPQTRNRNAAAFFRCFIIIQVSKVIKT
jgi:hydroxyacyl-ACP dehydratase HTD2-like protein with hotdog domain